MGYIRKRITQPTTWFGLASAAMALAVSGGTITPSVISALLAAAGLVHVDETRAPSPSA